MSEKMVVVCNHADPPHVMPTLIMGSSGVALDNEVILFFCPGGAQALLAGELEKIGTPKGLPNPVDLFNTILDQGGEIILCELALENKGIDPKDLRDERILIKKAPPYLMDVEGASQTYVF
ncbi:MAG: DsrE family protein [Anaerolineales bacterium]